MIVRKLGQAGGGRFPAAGYNENKVLEGVADLLLAKNVDEDFLNHLEVLHAIQVNAGSEVERYMMEHSWTYGNSKTKNRQFHVALSVKEHEKNKYELARFAKEFMEKMGYGRQPYFIYYHHDTNNNHVHILSTRINRYGIAISDSFDKMRMQRVSDEILGIIPEKQKQKLFSYGFQTEGQFLNVVRSCGYNPREETIDGVEGYTLFRNHYPQLMIPKEEIRSRMISKDSQQSKDEREQRARQLKAILLKYRHLSLQQLGNPQKGRAARKSDLEGRKTMALSGLFHKDGTPLSEKEKLQVKWLLNELRQKLSIDIHWQKDRNGVVRGYGIVDHKTKMAFDGSQVLRMAEWMDAGLKGETGKGQKVKGSLGQVPQTDEFVDYVSVFKHKNGDHYLRVSFKDYDHSVKFRLSQDEAWAYITAKEDGQRELLKRQFAAKYLLQSKDECRGQNREWEVGHGSYEIDDQRTLKR